MKKIKGWRNRRRTKKIKKQLAKLPASVQMGIAMGVIGSIAVSYPRNERRKFIVGMMDLLKELIKTQTEKKGDELCER